MVGVFESGFLRCATTEAGGTGKTSGSEGNPPRAEGHPPRSQRDDPAARDHIAPKATSRNARGLAVLWGRSIRSIPSARYPGSHRFVRLSHAATVSVDSEP